MLQQQLQDRLAFLNDDGGSIDEAIYDKVVKEEASEDTEEVSEEVSEEKSKPKRGRKKTVKATEALLEEPALESDK